MRDEIIERFSSLLDPDDGKPVVDRIYKREEVVSGPEAEDAPDLFPVCREYCYELCDGVYCPGILDDYRSLPRGFHHMDGIFGVAGPDVPAAVGLSREAARRVADLAVSRRAQDPRDGRRRDGRGAAGRDAPSRGPAVIEPMSCLSRGRGPRRSRYSAEEEAQIEESLRNLGYL